MAVLSWGKPKVEFGKLGAGDAAPLSGDWKEMPVIVDKTAKLNTEKGEKKEAKGEGGEVVDAKYDKNKYTFEIEVFVKKGDTKPIEDEDGVILDNYAVRLTPEDPTTEGFILDKTNVSVLETWTSDEGKKWKYTFDALRPLTGKICKPFMAP